MSADGYAVIRNSTLAWLLERARVESELLECPEEVARDLASVLNLGKVEAPVTPEDRLRGIGPILSPEQHEELLLDARELDLPRGKHDGAFWRLVVGVVHGMMSNEAEAVLRLIGAKEDD